jgi:hypothetical protein
MMKGGASKQSAGEQPTTKKINPLPKSNVSFFLGTLTFLDLFKSKLAEG